MTHYPYTQILLYSCSHVTVSHIHTHNRFKPRTPHRHTPTLTQSTTPVESAPIHFIFFLLFILDVPFQVPEWAFPPPVIAYLLTPRLSAELQNPFPSCTWVLQETSTSWPLFWPGLFNTTQPLHPSPPHHTSALKHIPRSSAEGFSDKLSYYLSYCQLWTLHVLSVFFSVLSIFHFIVHADFNILSTIKVISIQRLRDSGIGLFCHSSSTVIILHFT